MHCPHDNEERHKLSVITTADLCILGCTEMKIDCVLVVFDSFSIKFYQEIT